MGRTHPAWDAPPELPAGTMLTDIKRTMLRDLALMHQSPNAYQRLIHLAQQKGPDYV